MRGAIPLRPQYVFMAWCSVKDGTNLPTFKYIILNFSGDISIPNYFVVLCKAYNALCKSSSESEKSTWPSANNSVSCLHLFQFNVSDSSELLFHSYVK